MSGRMLLSHPNPAKFLRLGNTYTLLRPGRIVLRLIMIKLMRSFELREFGLGALLYRFNCGVLIGHRVHR